MLRETFPVVNTANVSRK